MGLAGVDNPVGFVGSHVGPVFHYFVQGLLEESATSLHSSQHRISSGLFGGGWCYSES